MVVWKLQEEKTRVVDVANDADIEGLWVDAHKSDLRACLLGGPKVEDFDVTRDRNTGLK